MDCIQQIGMKTVLRTSKELLVTTPKADIHPKNVMSVSVGIGKALCVPQKSDAEFRYVLFLTELIRGSNESIIARVSFYIRPTPDFASICKPSRNWLGCSSKE